MLSFPASALISDLAESSDQTEVKRVEDVSGPPRDGYTAITTQEFSAAYPSAELIVLAPNGTTAYVSDRWDTYFDVDPVPGHPQTVEYVAAEYLSDPECNGDGACTREVLVRENFSTGKSRVLWSRISPNKESARIHDIDRINRTHIVVADIYRDAVFIYDLERELQVWTWHAQTDFPIDGGGEFPDDWTHVNDVEVLEDGRLMVSLRNQDTVVFLARNGTLLSDQNIGADDQHDVLYEQHNPDYLRGETPAVLVADSENNRIVEYERNGSKWTQTWSWRDDELQWPRDADRLPNNHTLGTDTNGNRVFEINESGAVVWSATVGLPYDAERLSTGDESAGGAPASEAELSSRGVVTTDSTAEETETGPVATIKEMIRTYVPKKMLNGLLFVLPPWATWWHLPLLVGGIVDLIVWGWLEFRWSRWSLQSPLFRER